MSFRKAREIFEKVQEEALNQGDTATEGIAAGFIELAKAMAAELRSLENKINSLEQKVQQRR